MPKGAWITFLTGSDAGYLVGIFVLADSLRQVGSAYPLIVGVDRRQSSSVVRALEQFGLQTFECETIAPEVAEQCGVAERFIDCFTKIRAWQLEEYDRVVLIDSDVLVRRNADELMTMELPEDGIAAAHCCVCNKARSDWAPEDWCERYCPYTRPRQVSRVDDCSPRTYALLNSGVVALKPSRKIYDALLDHLSTAPDVDEWLCPDQDLMASYFGRKRRTVLPLTYNAIKTARHWHPEHWNDDEMKIVHCAFSTTAFAHRADIVDKPWSGRIARNHEDETTHSWWWSAYDQLREKATDAQKSALSSAKCAT